MRSKRSSPWLMALGHGLNDGYGSMLTVLLPLLIDRLGLSLALAGLLSSVRSSAASFTQVPLGAAVDRGGARWLVIVGPAVTTTSMCMLGLAPSFAAVAGLLVVVGLGTAAFHPAAAAVVGDESRGGRGAAMAVFSAGGTVGAALGPLAVSALVGRMDMGALPLLLFPAWLGVAALAWWAPRQAVGTPNTRSRFRGHPHTPKLVRLWGMEVLKEVTSLSFFSFLAVLWTERGASLTWAGGAVTLYALSGTLGGLIAGRLSDRWGRRRVILWSLVGAAPCLYLFLLSDGAMSMLFLSLGAMLQLSSTPVAVTFAQELFPDHRGAVSGVLMGLGWGVGAMSLTLVGYLGDVLGLEVALGIVAILLVPAAAVTAGLPKGVAPEPGPPHLPPG